MTLRPSFMCLHCKNLFTSNEIYDCQNLQSSKLNPTVDCSSPSSWHTGLSALSHIYFDPKEGTMAGRLDPSEKLPLGDRQIPAAARAFCTCLCFFNASIPLDLLMTGPGVECLADICTDHFAGVHSCSCASALSRAKT